MEGHQFFEQINQNKIKRQGLGRLPLRWYERNEDPPVTVKVVAEFARLANQALRPQVPESHLSEREIEVLRLVTKGATNREIAATLVIAEGTVRNHLT